MEEGFFRIAPFRTTIWWPRLLFQNAVIETNVISRLKCEE